jgi:hypothetical protein
MPVRAQTCPPQTGDRGSSPRRDILVITVGDNMKHPVVGVYSYMCAEIKDPIAADMKRRRDNVFFYAIVTIPSESSHAFFIAKNGTLYRDNTPFRPLDSFFLSFRELVGVVKKRFGVRVKIQKRFDKNIWLG